MIKLCDRSEDIAFSSGKYKSFFSTFRLRVPRSGRSRWLSVCSAADTPPASHSCTLVFQNNECCVSMWRLQNYLVKLACTVILDVTLNLIETVHTFEVFPLLIEMRFWLQRLPFLLSCIRQRVIICEYVAGAIDPYFYECRDSPFTIGFVNDADHGITRAKRKMFVLP